MEDHHIIPLTVQFIHNAQKITAEVLQPYSVRRFNAILDLVDARDTFAAKDGEAFVNFVFITLVKKRGLEEKVGLSF
jgi:hypothetical protein